jgi:hypothetical protein
MFRALYAVYYNLAQLSTISQIRRKQIIIIIYTQYLRQKGLRPLLLFALQKEHFADRHGRGLNVPVSSSLSE